MIRAAEPLEARGFAPTQTSNPSEESAFPRFLRKVILAETRERFALAGWQGVSRSVTPSPSDRAPKVLPKVSERLPQIACTDAKDDLQDEDDRGNHDCRADRGSDDFDEEGEDQYGDDDRADEQHQFHIVLPTAAFE